jgi:hypothetical protein
VITYHPILWLSAQASVVLLLDLPLRLRDHLVEKGMEELSDEFLDV